MVYVVFLRGINVGGKSIVSVAAINFGEGHRDVIFSTRASDTQKLGARIEKALEERVGAMVNGPRAGLALLGTLDSDERMAQTHRLEAVHGHLLERAGDLVAARESYRKAARMTASIPEQRYLALKAARLA